MSDQKHEEAATGAAAGDGATQTGAPPRVLRLGVRTHGTADTTEVYDRDTGAAIHFDAHMIGSLDAGPGRPNRARLVLTFEVPVECSERVSHPVDLHGFSVGARPGIPQRAPVAPPLPQQGGAPKVNMGRMPPGGK